MKLIHQWDNLLCEYRRLLGCDPERFALGLNLRNLSRGFHHDPMQEDISGKCLNPDGTLTEFLWKLQIGINPDKSSLWPLLDFEEHFQKVFLRRGLVIYCTLILRNLETVQIYSDAIELAFPP